MKSEVSQPDSFSNGVTQSYAGSASPTSVYPFHAIRLQLAFAFPDRVVGLRGLDRASTVARRRVLTARGRDHRQRRDRRPAIGSPSSCGPLPRVRHGPLVPPVASTGRLLLRSHRSRTALPRTCSASIELVSRFCSITTSSPPPSSSTMYRVIAPRYTTSRTRPVAVHCESVDFRVAQGRTRSSRAGR